MVTSNITCVSVALSTLQILKHSLEARQVIGRHLPLNIAISKASRCHTSSCLTVGMETSQRKLIPSHISIIQYTTLSLTSVRLQCQLVCCCWPIAPRNFCLNVCLLPFWRCVRWKRCITGNSNESACGSIGFSFQKPALIVNIVQAHMRNLSKQTSKETLNWQSL